MSPETAAGPIPILKQSQASEAECEMIGSSEVERFKRQEGSTDRKAWDSEVQDRHPGAGPAVQSQGKELTKFRTKLIPFFVVF